MNHAKSSTAGLFSRSGKILIYDTTIRGYINGSIPVKYILKGVMQRKVYAYYREDTVRVNIRKFFHTFMYKYVCVYIYIYRKIYICLTFFIRVRVK